MDRYKICIYLSTGQIVIAYIEAELGIPESESDKGMTQQMVWNYMLEIGRTRLLSTLETGLTQSETDLLQIGDCLVRSYSIQAISVEIEGKNG